MLKIKECANKQQHLNGVQCVASQKLKETFEKNANLDKLGYHIQCYRSFTDKTKIVRAIKRCAKQRNIQPDEIRHSILSR